VRLHTIRAQGLGPLVAPIELDVDALRGPLVAIVGPNGEGKSTLLEAALAAIDPDRKTPTRGTLLGLADGHGRGSTLEVEFTFRHRTKIRHELGRERSYVSIDGTNLDDLEGKVSKVAAWSRQNMLPPAVARAAVMLPQRSEGLIEADGAERRAILLRAIGVEEMEGLAKGARAQGADAARALADHDQAIAVKRSAAAPEGERAGALTKLRASLAAAEERQRRGQERLSADTDALRGYQVRAETAAVAGARAEAAARRLCAAHDARADLERRRAKISGAWADSAEIRQAADRSRAISTEIHAIEATRSADLAIAEREEAAAAAAHAAVVAERARWRAADQRHGAAQGRMADRVAVEAAAEELPRARAAVAALEQELAALDERVEALRAITEAGTLGRIEGLRTSLGSVATARRLDDAKKTARAGLSADDIAAAAIDRGTELDDLVATRAGTADRLDTARATLLKTERNAARAEDVKAAASDHAAAMAERAAAETAGKAAKEEAAGHEHAAGAARAKVVEVDSAIADLRAELDGLRDLADREGEIAGAEAQLGTLDEMLRAADVEIQAAEEEVAGAPPPENLGPPPDVEAAKGEIAAAGAEVAHLTAAVALAERDLEAAVEAGRELAVLLAERPALVERHQDWLFLAECLGLTGMQSLEIDAAGPRLTTEFNDLLHQSYGGRYSGEVNATRRSKDKKKDIDECEILVLDTLRNRSQDVRLFSGGQRVPLTTAFFLSLAIYLCNTRGLEAPTLLLDEPGSGLDEENFGPWLDMLRLASRRVRASKVLVVTHDRRVVDAADSVVEIRGGQLTILR